MAYAIDRQAMIDYLLNGQATPATGLLSPANWAYEPEVQTYSYDVEKAKPCSMKPDTLIPTATDRKRA
jgi:peptide/nickel transport system substrate-binding protein